MADRTGASAIIGVRDGQLVVEPDNQCRGFGFGHHTLEAELARRPEPTVANGSKILRDCRQGGPFATKYSNIYDLKSGDVFLYPVPGGDDEVKLSLAAELAKGAHYYEMPEILEQLAEAPRSLPLRMKRFPLDEFKPIPDQEPEVTAHLRAMLLNLAAGTSHAGDYTAEAWRELSSKRKEIQDSMKFLGDLSSLTLVQRREEKGQRNYFYRLEFANAAVLQHFILDGQNQLVSGESEGAELKPGAIVPEVPSVPVGGIGISLRVERDSIFVDEIVPGTPAAAQMDLHAGDRLIAVAQDAGPAVPVHGGKLAQALELIHGQVGSTVRLTIVPAGADDAQARVVSFVRAKLKTPLH